MALLRIHLKPGNAANHIVHITMLISPHRDRPLEQHRSLLHSLLHPRPLRGDPPTRPRQSHHFCLLRVLRHHQRRVRPRRHRRLHQDQLRRRHGRQALLDSDLETRKKKSVSIAVCSRRNWQSADARSLRKRVESAFAIRFTEFTQLDIGRGYGRRCSVLTSSTKRACCDGRVERPARAARVSKNVIWNPHCAVLTVVAQNIHRPISVLQWHGCLRQLLCGTAVHALHVHEGSVAHRTLGLNAGEVMMLWASGGAGGGGGRWWWWWWVG